jgi:N-terminal domain of reverse transcriptase
LANRNSDYLEKRGKVLAVRRVTENNGKKTPGVDQEIWDTPEKKTQAVHELKRRGYQPQPLRRVYIPKSDGKTMRSAFPPERGFFVGNFSRTAPVLNLIRYADDFIITGRTQELLEGEIKPPSSSFCTNEGRSFLLRRRSRCSKVGHVHRTLVRTVRVSKKQQCHLTVRPLPEIEWGA